MSRGLLTRSAFVMLALMLSFRSEAAQVLCRFSKPGVFILIDEVSGRQEISIVAGEPGPRGELTKNAKTVFKVEADEVRATDDFFGQSFIAQGMHVRVFKAVSGSETFFRGVIRIVASTDLDANNEGPGLLLLSEKSATGVEETLAAPYSELSCRFL